MIIKIVLIQQIDGKRYIVLHAANRNEINNTFDLDEMDQWPNIYECKTKSKNITKIKSKTALSKLLGFFRPRKTSASVSSFISYPKSGGTSPKPSSTPPTSQLSNGSFRRPSAIRSCVPGHSCERNARRKPIETSNLLVESSGRRSALLNQNPKPSDERPVSPPLPGTRHRSVVLVFLQLCSSFPTVPLAVLPSNGQDKDARRWKITGGFLLTR
ncbi:hypothetical protein GWI33_005642 [Rhynchophorus ferrugineus]|uniref:Uncharacterized protein n=1 Tax=Rhynchophorus ferrugineus TaxID=354439 RepID=A0A834MDL8_RHYFE|nr:hypothetical protein GWI33_005642 [Rhynchophorus ferrugineus]